jgi:ABC-2 type transport system ATP-binding protein
MEALIELKAARKEFGKLLAVAGLDLQVTRGEICGLLGHNGAGKSTAIGMMLGQVWPTSGEVRLFGCDVTTHRRQALLKVGAIFETPVFYDYLSGWRNLEILAHYSGPTNRQRMQEVVAWVGLEGRVHSKVKTYSHGMRARLAIAQALLPAPELLILDEPSDGLDPEGIHEMRHTILRLRQELGLTILLSSHLLNEVEQLCTRIAVLNQGRKVFEGDLAQAIRRQNWFYLRTDDFPATALALTRAGLITESRDGRCIALADSVGSERIAEFLVANRMPVYEIALEEQTLERFYLSLMQREKARTTR